MWTFTRAPAPAHVAEALVKANYDVQCSFHNFIHEEKPGIYEASFIQRFGEEALADLRRRARSMAKITPIELDAKFHEYQEMWRRLQGKAA